MQIKILTLVYLLIFSSCFAQTAPEPSNETVPEQPTAPETDEEQKQKELAAIKSQQEDLVKEIERYKTESKNITIPEKIDLKGLSKTLDEKDLSLQAIKTNKATIENYVTDLKNTISSAEALREADRTRLRDIPEELAKAKQKTSDISKNSSAQSALDQKLLEAKLNQLAKLEEKLRAEEVFLNERIKTKAEDLNLLAERLTEAQELRSKWEARFSNLESERIKRYREALPLDAEKIDEKHEYKAEIKLAIETAKILQSGDLSKKARQLEYDYTNLVKVLETLKEQKNYAEKRLKLLEETGLTVDIGTGQLLRQQRASLPSARVLASQFKETIVSSTANNLFILELQNSLSNLPEPNVGAEDLADDDDDGSESIDKNDALLLAVRQISEIALSRSKNLSSAYEKLQTLQNETIKKANEYSIFLNENLLWIASHPTLTLKSAKEEVQFASSYFVDTVSGDWLKSVVRRLSGSPFLWSIPLILLIAALSQKGRIRKLALAKHEQAASRQLTNLYPVAAGLGLEILFCCLLPITLILLSLISSEIPAISKGFLSAAITLSISSTIKNLCIPDGFIISNFTINEVQRKTLYQCSSLVQVIGTPLIFLSEVLTYSESVVVGGRVITILNLLFIATIAFLLFRPSKNIIGAKEASVLPLLVCVVFIGITLAIALSSFIGYHYSALILKQQLLQSLRIISLVLFLMFLLKRILRILRRNMAVNSINEEPDEKGEFAENTLSRMEIVKLKLENVSEVNEQTSKLINIGAIAAIVISLSALWAESFPALKVLDEIPVWKSSTSQVETKVPQDPISSVLTLDGSSSEPRESAPSPSQPAPKNFISLQDVLFSLGVALFAYFLAANVPGLLEIILLNRLNLQAGTDFALKTATKYLIIIFGLSYTLSGIGISWSQVQWLAAAVSLGIGFGLQEVFANFVAGIILLFEKPIRIGDLVTVSGINGKVTEIKIRATTIRQFNSRELVVPNKEFITGQLVNWTLSDTILRFEILVGIAYGSDTHKARELLLQIVDEHPNVLKDPAPHCVFNAFGASSLDFILRGHVAGPEHLLNTQSELYFTINDVFNRENIEIAFPQQDIYIRSVEQPIKIQTEPQPAGLSQ